MNSGIDVLALQQEVDRLKAQLKASEAEKVKYKTLFDVSGDALSIIRLSTGKFIECNQAAIDLHGVESEDNFLDLTPADLSPTHQPCGTESKVLATEYITNALTEGPQLFQWVHSKLDGSTFPCLVSLTALTIEGEHYILAIGRDISELLEAQEKLHIASQDVKRITTAYFEEKEKFEKIVNLAPVGIAINKVKDGAFDYVNEELSRFSGYDIEELNTMDYWQLTPRKYEVQEHTQLQSLAETGRYGPYQKEYIHKDGHIYPVLLMGVKIVDSSGEEFICSVIQDISEQKAVEAELNSAKERAESAALRANLANNSAQIGIWEWDLEANTLIWDDWMYRLYGVDKGEFSGADEVWQTYVHPEDRDYALQSLNDAVEGKADLNIELRVVHPNGQTKILKANAEVIRDADGKARRVIGVNYDVTEKVNAIHTLEFAREQAEKASVAKSEFLANMSHEIRTPMNAILGGLQMVNSNALDSKSRVMLDNACSSAKSLLTIINDILDYSKIEDKKLVLESAPFSMQEVIKAVKFEVDGIVSNKGIQLVSKIDKGFLDGWLGDVVRVKQIALNLVSNAVKFTEKGQVEIILRHSNYGNKPAISLSVIDTGIGMSDEAQTRLFERFTQADTSTTRKFGGTGLGMSITLNLINMMDGNIEVESALGKGTTMTVTLPLEQTALSESDNVSKSLVPPQCEGKRILIAEDNEINQVVVQAMLEETKAELTIVENGKLAVEKAQREQFDLILMDIQMPVMDGIDAMLAIKEFNRTTPIIALTANAMVEDVNKYIKAGFTAHLGKPIDLKMLYGTLYKFLPNPTKPETQ